MKIKPFISICILCILVLYQSFYCFSQVHTLEEAKKKEAENKIIDAVQIYKAWLRENSGHGDFKTALHRVIQLDSNSKELLAFLYEIESLCRIQKDKCYTAESIAQLEEFHGNLTNARTYYLYVFNNETGEKRFASLLSASQILFKQGFFNNSRKGLDIILEHSKDNEICAKAGILISSIHIVRGEWEKAKKNYISLIKQYKSTTVYPVILLGYLDCLLFFNNEQEITKVLEVFRKYFSSSPEYTLALKHSGKKKDGRIFYYPSPSSFINENGKNEDFSTEESDDEPGTIYIQTGSFTMLENAEDMVKELKKKNVKATIKEKLKNNMVYYSVLIEVESSEPEIINEKILTLKEAGFEGFLVTE